MKPISRKRDAKKAVSKQVMRDETERLVKEALERKTLTVTQCVPDSYRGQMSKMRSVKSRLSRSRGGPGAIQV
jgi:hypothetical protein